MATAQYLRLRIRTAWAWLDRQSEGVPCVGLDTDRRSDEWAQLRLSQDLGGPVGRADELPALLGQSNPSLNTAEMDVYHELAVPFRVSSSTAEVAAGSQPRRRSKRPCDVESAPVRQRNQTRVASIIHDFVESLEHLPMILRKSPTG